MAAKRDEADRSRFSFESGDSDSLGPCSRLVDYHGYHWRLIPAEKLYEDIALHGDQTAKFAAFAQKFWAQLPTSRCHWQCHITHPLRRSKFPKDFTPNAANLEVRMAASIEEAISRRKEKQDAMMKDGSKDESTGENDQTEEQVTATGCTTLDRSRTVSLPGSG